MEKMKTDGKENAKEEGIYEQEPAGHCLECGDPFSVRYGRPEKKFCSPDCRSRYHYRESRKSGLTRTRVIGRLDRNYGILNELVSKGIRSLDYLEARIMGLDPDYCTACMVTRSRVECWCYDISYRRTDTRIMNISKSLTNFGGLKIK